MRFSKYRKIFVYVLTFLTYAWSGYGADLLGNLRDAVLAAETVFGDFFQDAVRVARKFKDVHDVIDVAAEDTCVFTCPGGVQPRPNWNHTPQSNGCGSFGLEKVWQEFFDTPEITGCCNVHDICYDTCNSDKEKCDLEFKRCLYKYCDSFESTSTKVVRACRTAAKLFFSGTTTLGCKSYLDAQSNACYCGDRKNNKYKDPKREKWGKIGRRWVVAHHRHAKWIEKVVMGKVNGCNTKKRSLQVSVFSTDETTSKNRGGRCVKRNKKKNITCITRLAHSTNPFILFFLRMQRKRPKKPVVEVARKAGKLWCQMTVNQRKKYIELAQAEKRRKEAKRNKRKCRKHK